MRPEESAYIPRPSPELPPITPQPPTQSPLERAGVQHISSHNKNLSDYKISDITAFYGELPGGTPNRTRFRALMSDLQTPESLDWWEKAVQRAFEVTSAFTITENDIHDFFKTDQGLGSIATPGILKDLVDKKIVLPKKEFLKLPEAKQGWGAYLASFIWAPKQEDASTDEYVYLPNVKKTCDAIVAWIDRNPDPLKCVMTKAEFQKTFPEGTDLILRYLEGTLQRAQTWENGLVLLREPGILSATDLQKEQALLNLKEAQSQLNLRITALETNEKHAKKKAVDAHKDGDKMAAKRAIQALHLIQKQLERTRNNLQNLDTVAMHLDEASFMPKVVQGLKLGAEAMKAQNNEFSVEEADDIMLDVEETFKEQAEIGRALAGERNEEEMELEQELAALGNESSPPPPSSGGGRGDVDVDALLEELDQLDISDKEASLPDALPPQTPIKE